VEPASLVGRQKAVFMRVKIVLCPNVEEKGDGK
jgi:hypothetical protein